MKIQITEVQISDFLLYNYSQTCDLISDFDQKHIDMIVTHKFEGGDKSILEVGLPLKRLEGKG